MVVCVCAGLSVCLAVPRVLVAGGDIVSGVIVITDREVKRVGTGATILVGIVEGVCTRGSVIVVVPSVGIAGILVERLVCALIDCQV